MPGVLVIRLKLDVNPQLEDPHSIVEDLLYDAEGEPMTYRDIAPEFISAEWED